ncbi:MAG: glutathione S-transferase family protein [Elainellaceae cyanobacterium]
MIKLYHNPMTRSLRVLWLLEELGLDYVLETVEFVPPTSGKAFVQHTPTGKFPTIEDGEITMCESGAIVAYLIERYGGGRLTPPLDSPLRAKYLQWLHFPEGILNPYINAIQRFAALSPAIAADLGKELDRAIALIDNELANHPYIVGEEFTGADIMLAVSLLSLNLMGLLGDRHSHIATYLARLQTSPALVNALEKGTVE